MKVLPHTRSCFVCGESNSVGFNLRFETDGQTVQVRFVPRAEHIGFKQIVHGGLIGTILDELMFWACAVKTRRVSFCAELNVRFLKPARPGDELVATGELAADKRGKVFEARAELKALDGSVVATATGKYLPIKPEEAADFATEFVEDASWLFK